MDLDAVGVVGSDYEEHFYQNVPEGELEFPDLAGFYDTFKDAAIQHGRYYSTDAAGNIYRDGIEPGDPGYDADTHLVSDFAAEFSAPDTDGDGVPDRDGNPEDVVFIDTVDGNPPADDGSNLADVSVSGSLALEGFYSMAANFTVSGV